MSQESRVKSQEVFNRVTVLLTHASYLLTLRLKGALNG
jgi:hypothetical protein